MDPAENEDGKEEHVVKAVCAEDHLCGNSFK